MMRFLSWLNAKLGIVVDDPDPHLSRLDLMDGLPGCLACDRPAEPDGLCLKHRNMPFTEWRGDL